MRVLWTLPYLPWPITSGGKARQFHLLRQMAERGHAITLLVQSKTPADAAVHAALAPLVERLIVLPRRALRHPRTLWNAAFSRLPLLTSINGDAPELSRVFDQLLDERWDVVQIEHSYGLEPFLASLKRRAQPFIITEHNIESQLGAATYGKWPAVLRPFARYDQARAARWEQYALSQAAAVVAVTEEDAQALGRISGRPTYVVSNGVDVKAFAQVRPRHASQAVLFVGNYEYAPNVDAVEWAASEVLPRLWQRCPQARFMVCGHAMPESWRERFPDTRIEWRGYVASLPEVQSACAVFLAPLRFGGGSKLKVLEALAAGLPVVSTTEGLSGLGAQDRVHARVADTAEQMAQALAEVLGDEAQAQRLGQTARQWIAASHDWDAVAAQLERAYQAVAPTREAACA